MNPSIAYYRLPPPERRLLMEKIYVASARMTRLRSQKKLAEKKRSGHRA